MRRTEGKNVNMAEIYTGLVTVWYLGDKPLPSLLSLLGKRQQINLMHEVVRSRNAVALVRKQLLTLEVFKTNKMF